MPVPAGTSMGPLGVRDTPMREPTTAETLMGAARPRATPSGHRLEHPLTHPSTRDTTTGKGTSSNINSSLGPLHRGHSHGLSPPRALQVPRWGVVPPVGSMGPCTLTARVPPRWQQQQQDLAEAATRADPPHIPREHRGPRRHLLTLHKGPPARVLPPRGLHLMPIQQGCHQTRLTRCTQAARQGPCTAASLDNLPREPRCQLSLAARRLVVPPQQPPTSSGRCTPSVTRTS